MIEDLDRAEFRHRLEEVLNRYNEERIFNIDTGMVHDKYDSQGCPQMYYYAIIIFLDNNHMMTLMEICIDS